MTAAAAVVVLVAGMAVEFVRAWRGAAGRRETWR